MNGVFIAFLKRHRAYKYYILNHVKYLTTCNVGPWTELGSGEYLTCSFLWSGTPQGVAYWGRLDDLWNDQLKNTAQ